MARPGFASSGPACKRCFKVVCSCGSGGAGATGPTGPAGGGGGGGTGPTGPEGPTGVGVPGEPPLSMQFADAAGTAFQGEPYWLNTTLSGIAVGVDQAPPFGHGFFSVYSFGNEPAPVTPPTAIGLIRLTDLVADNGGLNSFTVVSFFSSSAGGVQVAALGVTGGTPFFGDPNGFAAAQIWGFLDIILNLGPIGIITIAGTNYNFTGGGPLTVNTTGDVRVDHTTQAIVGDNIDWNVNSYFELTLAGGVNTLTFSNVPAVGNIIVALTGVGGSSVVWPVGTQWAGGTTPTQTAAGKDIYTLVSIGGVVVGNVVPNVS